jgi:hypothetical protein
MVCVPFSSARPFLLCRLVFITTIRRSNSYHTHKNFPRCQWIRPLFILSKDRIIKIHFPLRACQIYSNKMVSCLFTINSLRFDRFYRSQHVAEGSDICFRRNIRNIRSESDSLQSVEKDLHNRKCRCNRRASDIHFFAIDQPPIGLAPLWWLLTWENIRRWNGIFKPLLASYWDLPVGVNNFLCYPNNNLNFSN